MSSKTFHHALLRPAILQILRAEGFHGAKASVVDTLTDIVARYISLLAERSVMHAAQNHNDPYPTVADVRQSMEDCGLLAPTMTASEESWRELLRRPLEDIPEKNGLRSKEKIRRDLEDTEGVRRFIDWYGGNQVKEQKRIAGFIGDETMEGLDLDDVREDYVTVLKKKHSKTGEESRFQGTVLGKEAETKVIIIEGGPASIKEWQEMIITKRYGQASASTTRETSPAHGEDSSLSPADDIAEHTDLEMADANG